MGAATEAIQVTDDVGEPQGIDLVDILAQRWTSGMCGATRITSVEIAYTTKRHLAYRSGHHDLSLSDRCLMARAMNFSAEFETAWWYVPLTESEDIHESSDESVDRRARWHVMQADDIRTFSHLAVQDIVSGVPELQQELQVFLIGLWPRVVVGNLVEIPATKSRWCMV